MNREKALETTDDTDRTDREELAKTPPFTAKVTESWARPIPAFFDPWHP